MTARERAHAVLDSGPGGQVLIPGTSLAGALRELKPVLRVTISIAGPWRTGNGEEPPGEGKPIPLLRTGGKSAMPHWG